MTPLRIAVLDDHPVVRAGLRAVVETSPDLVHVGDAAGEAELWPLLRDSQPDILLADLHHPGRDGFSLATLLARSGDGPRVVLYLAARSDELTVAAELAGVTSTISKTESRRTLVDALRAAGEPGARHERLDLLARGRVLGHLEPTDQAIAAMRLEDTPLDGIADALRIAPSEVGRRLEFVVRRLTLVAPSLSGQGRRAQARLSTTVAT